MGKSTAGFFQMGGDEGMSTFSASWGTPPHPPRELKRLGKLFNP